MSKSKSQTRKSPPKDSQTKVRVIDNAKQYLGPPINKIIIVHASKFAKESLKRGGKRRKTQKRRRTQKK
jgi:hypothetical protein